MSTLHHPNVVQFLGVCFLQDCSQPVLVMEKLEDNLHSLLEMVSNIPLVLKYAMLEDAARGLHYLHSHDIIHRDLTANNILLTSSLVAKISDLGNSRIVAQHTGQLAQTLSRYPGSLVYMPPEALTTSAKYGTSLDIFSFGHLALFTLTQVSLKLYNIYSHCTAYTAVIIQKSTCMHQKISLFITKIKSCTIYHTIPCL